MLWQSHFKHNTVISRERERKRNNQRFSHSMRILDTITCRPCLFPRGAYFRGRNLGSDSGELPWPPLSVSGASLGYLEGVQLVTKFLGSLCCPSEDSNWSPSRLQIGMVQPFCRRVGTQHLMLGCHLRWMWERKKKYKTNPTKYHKRSTLVLWVHVFPGQMPPLVARE